MKKRALSLTLVVVLQGCSGDGMLTRGNEPSVITLPKPQVGEITGKRLALVIGNANYTVLNKLVNAGNDAEDISKTLRELGFEVLFIKDAKDKRQMQEVVDEFGKKLQGSSIGLFYYAGHGIQTDGKNYLIPAKADLRYKEDAEFEAMEANYVLRKMESAGNEVNLVVLDACRTNDLPSRTRSAQTGLARMIAPQSPKGSLIAFSTSPNAAAEDGTGRNGTYTKHLLSMIKAQGLTIQEMFNQVRDLVVEETKQRRNPQIPWEESSLRGGKLCLAGCENPDKASEQAALQKAVIQQEQTKFEEERRQAKQREDDLQKKLQEIQDNISKNTSGNVQQSEQMQHQLKLLEQEKQRLDAERIRLEQEQKKLQENSGNRSAPVEKPAFIAPSL